MRVEVHRRSTTSRVYRSRSYGESWEAVLVNGIPKRERMACKHELSGGTLEVVLTCSLQSATYRMRSSVHVTSGIQTSA
jgi:hypothetical protein